MIEHRGATAPIRPMRAAAIDQADAILAEDFPKSCARLDESRVGPWADPQ